MCICIQLLNSPWGSSFAFALNPSADSVWRSLVIDEAGTGTPKGRGWTCHVTFFQTLGSQIQGQCDLKVVMFFFDIWKKTTKLHRDTIWCLACHHHINMRVNPGPYGWDALPICSISTGFWYFLAWVCWKKYMEPKAVPCRHRSQKKTPRIFLSCS